MPFGSVFQSYYCMPYQQIFKNAKLYEFTHHFEVLLRIEKKI